MRRLLAISWLAFTLGSAGAVPASASNDIALQLANVSATNTGYVRVPDSPAFSLQTFTLEAWIQQVGVGYGVTTDAGGSAIIAKPSEGNIGTYIASWHLSWNSSGQIVFNLTHALGSSGIYVVSTPVANPLARHHLAATFDGSTVQLYVDGVPNASGAWTLGTVYYGPEDVLIGADNFGFGYLRRFDGFIDDVRVWDHARTASEIAGSMNCSLTGGEPGLVAYWSYDHSDLTDLTGHGHGGTAVTTAGAVTFPTLVPLGACTAAVGDPIGQDAPRFSLSLFPQPAGDRITADFALPRPGPVTVDLLDVAGRRLAVWEARDYPAGPHQITGSLAALLPGGPRSGVVFVRLRAGGRSAVRLLVIRR